MTRSLDRIAIFESATIRDAMETIDRGAVNIALVVSESGALIGTVTDGNIRRAILGGASLSEPVSVCMHRQFVAVGVASNRTEVLDLMRARSLEQIPILDERGQLLGLHLLREIIGSAPRPNWAVIMAGGRGERLRPLTDNLPKPMVKVAGRPILERIVLHLVGTGIERIFVSVNYKAGVIERHFGDGGAFGCRMDYLREDKPLGSGGALSLLDGRPEQPILVMNGDLLSQFDVGRMLEFHIEGMHKLTVGVHEYLHTVPYGVVECAGDRLTGLREKPVHSCLANTGIYAIEPDLLERVPKDTFFPLPVLIEECLERDESVGAFQITDDWIDVGHPQELKRARGEGDSQ
jgi:dTDP-glucose pyrophosphorylase